jgi:hypothetical protein
LQVPGRERQLFGDHEERQGSQVSLLCPLHALCRVADAGQEMTLGKSERITKNNFSRLSVESSFSCGWLHCSRPENSSSGISSHMQSRHRREEDRACDRHELTFTLSIAVVIFSPHQIFPTARSRLPVATPQRSPIEKAISPMLMRRIS